MGIELTPEQEAIITSRVNARMYESPTAMIDQALMLLEEREHQKAKERAFFEREIKPSLESLDRGEGTPLDMNEIIAEANKRLDTQGVDF